MIKKYFVPDEDFEKMEIATFLDLQEMTFGLEKQLKIVNLQSLLMVKLHIKLQT